MEAGRSVQAFDTRWGRAAILICEDAWHSLTPTLAALDGAQLIIVPSAWPARGIGAARRRRAAARASLVRWERGSRRTSPRSTASSSSLAQLVGFEGGKAFPGGSVVVGPRGEICWPRARCSRRR